MEILEEITETPAGIVVLSLAGVSVGLAVLAFALLWRPERILYGTGFLLVSLSLVSSTGIYQSLLDIQRLPPGIPIGYLTILLPAVVAFAGIILRGKLNLKWLGKFPFTLPLGALLAYAFLSGLWVIDHRSWLLYSLMWGVHGIVVMGMVAYILSRNLGRALAVLKFYILSVGFVSLIGVVKYLATRDNFFWSNPMPGLVDNNAIPFLVVTLIPVVFALVITTKRSISFIVLCIVLALMLIQTGLSMSRTGYIGAIFGMGLFAIFALIEIKPVVIRVKMLLSITILGMVLISILVVSPESVQGFLHRLGGVDNIYQILFGVIPVGEPDWHRQHIAMAAVEVIRERFWLGTGVGLENYLHYFPKDLEGVHGPMVAHNFYLTYLAQFGIFGYILLLSFFITLSYLLWTYSGKLRDVRLRTISRGFFFGHIAALVMLAGNEYITAPFLWYFWGLAVGILEAARYEQNSACAAVKYE